MLIFIRVSRSQKPSAGLDERQEHGLSIARSLSSTERCPLTRIPYKETVGSPKFPSYPHGYMPWSQTPVVSRILAIAHPGLLLSDTLNRVSFHLNLPRFILMTTTIHISGLNTEPASLLPPASDSRCRVCLRIQLLTCRLNFSQVGLSQYSIGITHWVTLTNFIPTYRDSQGLGFTLARATLC